MKPVFCASEPLLFLAIFAAFIKRGCSQTPCLQENTQCITRWQGMSCKTDCVEDSTFTCLQGLCLEGQNCTCQVERFSSGCTQSDTCISGRNGSCVVGCVASDTFECLPNLCTDSQYCMCKAPKACPNTTPCKAQGGVCDASCPVTDPTIQCLDGLCADPGVASPCKCKIATPQQCPQTSVCAAQGGVCDINCVPSTDGSNNVVCLDGCSDPQFPNCKCKVVKPTNAPTMAPSPRPTSAPNQDNCPTTDQCKSFGGKCLFKCVPTPGTTQLCLDWCGLKDCQCLVTNNCPQTLDCTKRGGRCEIGCAPSPDGTVHCLDICDTTKGCLCKVVTPKPTLSPTQAPAFKPPRPSRSPTMPPTPHPTMPPKKCIQLDTECRMLWKGFCTNNCFDDSLYICPRNLCREKYCKCKIKRGPNTGCGKTKACAIRSGTCVVGCVPSYQFDCHPGLCTSSLCSCQVERQVCQKAEVDWQCGDPITQCQPLGKPLCVCDIDTEGTQFCWNNDWCAESEPCTSSLNCPAGKRCASSCCGFACLPECGAGGIGINHRRHRRLDEEDEVVEETENGLHLRRQLQAGPPNNCELSAAGECCDSECLM